MAFESGFGTRVEVKKKKERKEKKKKTQHLKPKLDMMSKAYYNC